MKGKTAMVDIPNKPYNVMTTQKYTDEQLKYFRENYPYNDEGFFSLKGYFEEIVGPNWRTKSFSMIIQAGRNMGKSYGTWDFIENEIWIKSNFTERIAYLRTNMTKLKQVKGFFNSKYRGKYLMTDTHIWKIALDENGKEIREQRIELGVVIGVMNEENWRSGEFAKYRMIFWDEYNESTNHVGLWEHWVNLFKTIERMTPNMIALLVGNKINANNDILVNLEIEIPDHTNQEQDFLITKKDHTGEDRIYFVDIANATFAHLNQENKLANIWATFNEKTDIFLNQGGYLERQKNDVIIYRTRIKPSKVIKYYVAYGQFLYEFGTFERGVYFHKVNEAEDGYRVLALDLLGNLSIMKSRRMYSIEDYEDLAEMLARKAKAGQLFYSSFETKTELDNFIIKYTSIIGG